MCFVRYAKNIGGFMWSWKRFSVTATLVITTAGITWAVAENVLVKPLELQLNQARQEKHGGSQPGNSNGINIQVNANSGNAPSSNGLQVGQQATNVSGFKKSHMTQQPDVADSNRELKTKNTPNESPNQGDNLRTDKQRILQSYLERYLANYSNIDLRHEIQCDEKYMDRYREAKDYIDLIEAQAKDLNRKDILDFVRQKKAGVHIITGDCTK